MFRIKNISFNHGESRKTYNFTEHTFIYGKNTRGKTALTVAIDYILGSSDKLTYQGLDNIDSIEALLVNKSTFLWIRRDICENRFFCKRTEGSEYLEVTLETYKKNIGLIICENRSEKLQAIYSKVFEEIPTFRAFNFLNYIEEKGLGDLSSVFTKAKELKHNIRVRNIMNFFFNFENIEQIYEKQVLLETKSKELNELADAYQEYDSCKTLQRKLFFELQLDYSGIYAKDYATFCNFRNSYIREIKKSTKDLVYLTNASFSLSEEIKLYNYMKNQSKNMADRKERTKRLLSLLAAIVGENPEYIKYVEHIESLIMTLDEENVILSLTDYSKAIRDIQSEKNRLDQQIEELRLMCQELSYEEAMKKVGLLEHAFEVLQTGIDIQQYEALQKETDLLRQEIKQLKKSFDQSKIKVFNDRLTEIYFNSGVEVQHLLDDMKEEAFSLEFDPFRLCLYAKHNVDGRDEFYLPGSMARQTHIQMLVYLAMFEYLEENFKGFLHMPLLIVDSANQPMGTESFEKIYPAFIEMAESIGIQTIFLSKDKIAGIDKKDFLDISEGLNPFHKG